MEHSCPYPIERVVSVCKCSECFFVFFVRVHSRTFGNSSNGLSCHKEILNLELWQKKKINIHDLRKHLPPRGLQATVCTSFYSNCIHNCFQFQSAFFHVTLGVLLHLTLFFEATPIGTSRYQKRLKKPNKQRTRPVNPEMSLGVCWHVEWAWLSFFLFHVERCSTFPHHNKLQIN